MGSHTKPRRAAGRDGQLPAILDSIRRVVRVLRVASRAAEKQVGLSAAQVYVLHVLAEGPAQSLNELAERTRTHQSSVSVVVQRLVDRGLVERTPVPGDARRLGLSLSAGAARVLRDSPDAPTELLIAGLERMPAATRARLAGGLVRLVKELGAAEAPATMLFEDDASPAPAKPVHAARRRAGAVRAARTPGRS